MSVNNFVGGYAGSGTRVIQMMLERAGIWVRSTEFSNIAYDELLTAGCFINIARLYIATNTDIDQRFIKDFSERFEKFRSGEENWSLKTGETMWCIPFLYELFPEATYVLVVRNGLDNVLNEHTWSEEYYRVFVNSDDAYQIDNFSLWGHRMAFWNDIHKRAIEEGEECFGSKFLIVKLEDIIRSPEGVGETIFNHLGLEFKSGYIDFVKPQISVNKHRETFVENNWGGHVYKPEVHLDGLKEIGKEMLTRLGYL